MTEDITLYAMSPHMHLRGKSLKWVIVYPDGREQTILNVPKFDFNWQFNYELKEPLKIPAGSKILGLGVYDNSIRNKWNPGPHLEVYWSEQSWDEMYQPFTEYSVDSQDLTVLKPVGSATAVTRAAFSRALNSGSHFSTGCDPVARTITFSRRRAVSRLRRKYRPTDSTRRSRPARGRRRTAVLSPSTPRRSTGASFDAELGVELRSACVRFRLRASC